MARDNFLTFDNDWDRNAHEYCYVLIFLIHTEWNKQCRKTYILQLDAIHRELESMASRVRKEKQSVLKREFAYFQT